LPGGQRAVINERPWSTGVEAGARAPLLLCATDESQVVWTRERLLARVRVGAGDDELKRRVWDCCLAALLALRGLL
jgi:hypothetical protein